MITFPDFTWEWIIENIQFAIEYFQQDPNSQPEHILIHTRSGQGLLDIIPKLREHPILEKLVPMKSMFNLRWFPSHDSEISLSYDQTSERYEISILRRHPDTRLLTEVEAKTVGFEEVPNEIYGYIINLRWQSTDSPLLLLTTPDRFSGVPWSHV